MKAHYYDPMFYLCSEEMPFSIRILVRMKEDVQAAALTEAVHTAMKRYPYFAMQIREADGEWLTEPNDRPVVVYEGPAVHPLGSEAVNRHIMAVSYEGREINFHITHVVTDGGGFFPFVKTVMYYYLTKAHGVELDTDGIRLAGQPLFDDEVSNPYPEEKMAAAQPLYVHRPKPFFRLRDGKYVTDQNKIVYRVKVSEAEMMRFNHGNDGSPCALVSSLMTRAIWNLHPDLKEDVTCAVSFNLRPGLGNLHNYRLLSHYILLRYPERMRAFDVANMCTCSRGMVTVQSQPENVLFYAQKMRERLETWGEIPGALAKRAAMAPASLADSVENTFSVSYAGKFGADAIESYMDTYYAITDGSTYRTLFIEISAANGWFSLAFLQGFSSDAYYRAFLEQLDLYHLPYEEEEPIPFGSADIELPGLEK